MLQAGDQRTRSSTLCTRLAGAGPGAPPRVGRLLPAAADEEADPVACHAAALSMPVLPQVISGSLAGPSVSGPAQMGPVMQLLKS